MAVHKSKKFHCPQPGCKRRFRTQFWLDKHLAKKHKGEMAAEQATFDLASKVNAAPTVADPLAKVFRLADVIRLDGLPLDVIQDLISRVR